VRAIEVGGGEEAQVGAGYGLSAPLETISKALGTKPRDIGAFHPGWMRMARLSLLLFCFLCLCGCKAQAAPPDTGQVVATSSDEEAERELILNKVRTAIDSSDFAGLSAMEEDFRSSRARTPSGVWKLAAFHAGLQAYLADGLQQEAGCEYRRAAFVQQWTDAAPRNPAPSITNAALLLDQAWCIRGPGYADTVAADAWPKFREKVAAAYGVLEAHAARASVDPEFYAIKLDVLRALGVDKPAFRKVIEEATEREPYYHRTYFNAVWYYMPQWGGSYAEVEDFARYAAERTRTSEHDGFYARVFWWLEECGCGIVQKAADWSRLKQAMRDVYDRYPVGWNGKYFADLSCRMGDGEEGRRYLRTLHPETKDDRSFAAMFAACDYQARASR
jgi:hypothetical protein